MKIYDKKSFAKGTFLVILGTLLLIMDCINHTFAINGAVLIFALYVMGGGLILRSLSYKLTKQQQLDEMDERNQLIALQSKSKAFQLTQIISFLLMLGMLVLGKVSGMKSLIAIAVGLAFAFSLSMFTEIFSFMYYDAKH